MAFFGSMPKWLKVGKCPDRLDALERRVAELEKLLEKHPADACPHCGARAARMESVVGRGDGTTLQRWVCRDCGFEEPRVVRPR